MKGCPGLTVMTSDVWGQYLMANCMAPIHSYTHALQVSPLIDVLPHMLSPSLDSQTSGYLILPLSRLLTCFGFSLGPFSAPTHSLGCSGLSDPLVSHLDPSGPNLSPAYFMASGPFWCPRNLLVLFFQGVLPYLSLLKGGP